MLGDCIVEILAASDHMIAVADRAVAVNQLAEETLAFFERKGARVKTIEAEQVEDVVADRHRQAKASDLTRVVDVHPSLQQLEIRAAAIVRGDNLAVEDEPVEWERVQCEYYFGISISNSVPLRAHK